MTKVRSQILILFALVLCLSGVSSAHARSDLQLGIEQFGGMHHPDTRRDILDRQKDLGASVIRFIARYDQIATCDPSSAAGGGVAVTNPANPCYDFAVTDDVLRGAKERGMNVTLSIYGVPGWYFGRGENWTGESQAEFERFAAGYAQFAQAVTTRYGGAYADLPRVTQWTIWNEPNGPFWEPRLDDDKNPIGPIRYAQLYDAAARTIKAVDAEFQVAVGPTAPATKVITPANWAQAVLERLEQYGSPVDAWAHNGYIGRQSPIGAKIDEPFVTLANLEPITSRMDRYSVSRGKPVWITEFGYQTPPAQQAFVSLAQQAQFTADAIRFAYTHKRISMLIFYSLYDDADPKGFQSGLLYSTARCEGDACLKPAASVFRHTIWVGPKAKNGSRLFWAQARRSPELTRIFVRPDKGKWRAYRNPGTAKTGTVSVRLKLADNAEVMVCDTSCGISRLVRPTNNTSITRKQKAIRLNKGPAVSRGIRYNIAACKNCRVTARIVARGKTSNVSYARNKQAVVARAKVRTLKSNRKQVVLRFTPKAKRALAGKKTSRLTIQTFVTDKNGRKISYQRVLTLR